MFCEESKATKDQKPDHWLFDEIKIKNNIFYSLLLLHSI